MAQNPYYPPPNGHGAPQPWPANQAGPSMPYAAQPYNNASGGYSGYTQYPQAYAWNAPSFGQTLFQGGYPGYSHPPPEPSQSKRARGNDVPSQSNALAWRNCSVPGCKFVGPGDQVDVHEQDRHLIFPNGHQVERSEEEERFAKRTGPPPAIEGTNITLQTDEDIAKWVAERRAKWPSAKRVADKEAERQDAIARGELPVRGRGRGGARGGRGRRNDPASQAEDWGRPEPEQSESGTRGRGRGGRIGRRGAGRGRGRGRGGAHGPPGRDRPQDSGWPEGTDHSDPTSLHPAPLNPLATLGAYDTASESDSDSASSATTSSWGSSSDGMDETLPTSAPEPTPDKNKLVCKFFAKNGRCKNGAKCRFAHVWGEQREHHPVPKQPQVPKRTNPFDRPGMLGALLATPIQNTLSQLSQTIRFLVANDMLENVELRPGDAEAQARQDNLITPVVESETLHRGTPEAGHGE